MRPVALECYSAQLPAQKFWASVFNIVDLVMLPPLRIRTLTDLLLCLQILMIFCIVTVLVIFFSGCSAKGEEVFDTFLLVIRNLIQVRALRLWMAR